MQTRPAGISVVVTVRDDRAALAELLDALARQERQPDEVVVVDAGSRDGTRELLEERRNGLPLSVLDLPGANISAGRNAGVRAAAHPRIACTDAGCRPARGWLRALDDALDDVEFAGGVYRVDARTPFERCLAAALYPSPEEIGDDDPLVRLSHRLFGRAFDVSLSTGRSMAFTKDAWQLAGGFPEHLYAGEDVRFSALVARSAPARLVPAAEVTWRPRPTWRANARMYAIYARGDIREGRRRRYAARAAAYAGGSAAALFGGRGTRAVALAAAGAYLGLPAVRAHRRRVPVRDWWRLPALIVMKDLSQCAGAAQGLVDAAHGRDQPRPGR